MTTVKAQKTFIKHPYDSVVYGFIFDAVLPSGVTISTVDADTIATVNGTSSTALTSTGEAANGFSFTDDEGNTVAIGKAVQSTIAGGTTGCVYSITMKITASNGEKYAGKWLVNVRES